MISFKKPLQHMLRQIHDKRKEIQNLTVLFSSQVEESKGMNKPKKKWAVLQAPLSNQLIRNRRRDFKHRHK